VSRLMPDQPTRDWATQLTDQIERVVMTVRDRTTRPALTVVRGLVFGIIAAAGGITALVIVSVVLIRALTELTGEAWIAYLITSGIFLAVGAFLMLKGASSAERDLESP
jgi:putative superfamily III holin-X